MICLMIEIVLVFPERNFPAFSKDMKYKPIFHGKSGKLPPDTGKNFFQGPPAFPSSAAALGKNFETTPGFHEGSAWNYTFYVPHDVKGLAKLAGGKKKFVERLQMVCGDGFSSSVRSGGRRLAGFRIGHRDLVSSGILVFE